MEWRGCRKHQNTGAQGNMLQCAASGTLVQNRYYSSAQMTPAYRAHPPSVVLTDSVDRGFGEGTTGRLAHSRLEFTCSSRLQHLHAASLWGSGFLTV